MSSVNWRTGFHGNCCCTSVRFQYNMNMWSGRRCIDREIGICEAQPNQTVFYPASSSGQHRGSRDGSGGGTSGLSLSGGHGRHKVLQLLGDQSRTDGIVCDKTDESYRGAGGRVRDRLLLGVKLVIVWARTIGAGGKVQGPGMGVWGRGWTSGWVHAGGSEVGPGRCWGSEGSNTLGMMIALLLNQVKTMEMADKMQRSVPLWTTYKHVNDDNPFPC